MRRVNTQRAKTHTISPPKAGSTKGNMTLINMWVNNEHLLTHQAQEMATVQIIHACVQSYTCNHLYTHTFMSTCIQSYTYIQSYMHTIIHIDHLNIHTHSHICTILQANSHKCSCQSFKCTSRRPWV